MPNYQNIKLRGIFDHYDVKETKTTNKDGQPVTYFKPQIILTSLTDITNGKNCGTQAFNLGVGFKRFGHLTKPTIFEFTARKDENNELSYPSKIIQVKADFEPLPDINDELLSGYIMHENNKTGRTDTNSNEPLINKYLTETE